MPSLFYMVLTGMYSYHDYLHLWLSTQQVSLLEFYHQVQSYKENSWFNLWMSVHAGQNKPNQPVAMIVIVCTCCLGTEASAGLYLVVSGVFIRQWHHQGLLLLHMFIGYTVVCCSPRNLTWPEVRPLNDCKKYEHRQYISGTMTCHLL